MRHTTSTPIKIGLVCGCTGPLAASDILTPDAFNAWADSVNARGGINGHKVDVIVENTADNPGTSLSEVERLVAQDHVLAIVNFGLDTGWSTYVEQHHVPVIGGSQATTPSYTNPDFFPVGQTENVLFTAVIAAVKRAGHHNLATFYCAESVVCEEGVPVLRKIASSAHTPLVYAASISASSPNYVAQCIAAKQAGAEVLYIADAITVDASASKSCRSQGYNVPVVIDGEDFAPSFSKTSSLRVDTLFTLTNVPLIDTKIPGVAAMVHAFQKYASSIMSNSDYNELQLLAWASGILFQEAASAGKLGDHGHLTTGQLFHGLYSLHDTTLDGLAPPLSYAPGKAHPVNCIYPPLLLRNGKWSEPYGLRPTCER